MAPPPPGGSLVNPSFESPALGSSYQYPPTASGVGWTFANGSGIQGNGSAWAAAAAPAGTQTAFIQGTGTISQSLSLTAGSYTLSFKAAQRSCCVSPYVQPIQVSVDGTPVGSPVSPTSTSFANFSVAISIATSGTHTITFGGTTGGDKSTFIDDVTLSAGSPPPGGTLVNPSFESPALGSSYQYTPTASGVGWTFAGGSGIQGNGSAWAAAAAPAGTQTAFIQSAGTISQALSLTAGSYTLSFKAAQRSCCVSPYVQPIQVSVDGTPVGNPVVADEYRLHQLQHCVLDSDRRYTYHHLHWHQRQRQDHLHRWRCIGQRRCNDDNRARNLGHSIYPWSERHLHGDGDGQCADR